MKPTILITKETKYLVASIKEIPAVITQGKSKQEVMNNIQDALKLYFDDMRAEEALAR